MSFINFEKATGRYHTKEEIEEKKKRHYEKKEAEYLEKKKDEVRSQLKAENQWMLPSLEEKLECSSSKKTNKKSKKKKSKKDKRPRRISPPRTSTDSSSTSSDSEEWDDKKSSKKKSKKSKKSRKVRGDKKYEKTIWESVLSKTEERKKDKPKKEINKCIIEKPGQSDRELNPYWKDGGCGLPEAERDMKLVDSSVGDYGLDWLKRSLKRAKETAEEQGRSLEDVVRERWGSLQKLESMIAEAEEKLGKTSRDRSSKTQSDYKDNSTRRDRERHDRSYRYERDCRRDRVRYEKSRSDFQKPCDNEDDNRRSYKRPEQDEKSILNFRKADYDGDEKRNERSRLNFKRPESDEERERSSRSDKESRYSFQSHSDDRASYAFQQSSDSRRRNWMKKDSKVEESLSRSETKKKEKSPSSSELEEEKLDKNIVEKKTLLTDEELNKLAAKVMKAEIMGNASLSQKLKDELEKARKDREEAINEAGKIGEKAKEETIVLMRTNTKGLTRPIQSSSLKEPVGGRRKKQKVDTHSQGQRMRYFADDDKHSLQDMFQREKLCSADEDKAMFVKLMGKSKRGNISDEDDTFLDKARFKDSEGKSDEKERNKAMKEAKSKHKSLEGCQWCLDSKNRPKHLIVSIGNKCYLCLPGEESLTEGHCLIVPVHHETCGTYLDEDVWEEVQKFRFTLTDMFLKQGREVIFFENARSFYRYPHMVLNCVPIDKEVGELAPIYFKKAILESESEWSNNKKVVDLSKKDLRRSVPKGLPYFAVDFGKDGGFAHVIEDEKLFPSNFAEEIIGGMLDLDHRKWRKHQKQNFNAQRDKVLQFAKVWKNYDFTLPTKRACSDSPSDSCSSSLSDSESSP